jgi:hypothetical protein
MRDQRESLLLRSLESRRRRKEEARNLMQVFHILRKRERENQAQVMLPKLRKRSRENQMSTALGRRRLLRDQMTLRNLMRKMLG